MVTDFGAIIRKPNDLWIMFGWFLLVVKKHTHHQQKKHLFFSWDIVPQSCTFQNSKRLIVICTRKEIFFSKQTIEPSSKHKFMKTWLKKMVISYTNFTGSYCFFMSFYDFLDGFLLKKWWKTPWQCSVPSSWRPLPRDVPGPSLTVCTFCRCTTRRIYWTCKNSALLLKLPKFVLPGSKKTASLRGCCNNHPWKNEVEFLGTAHDN